MANDIGHGDVPPVYRIDLSLPPSERYVELAEIYRDQMRSLTGLFDDLVASLDPRISVKWVRRLARLCLRKLYDSEETEEIRGISRVTGIDLYLLVALNVLLDPLMGCTSGAALTKGRRDEDSKMLHFRTLDWGMDGLRQLIVQLEFVRSPEADHVLARSTTYVGYVGVLTGVRKELSVSLNFRPYHDMSSNWKNYKFYASHVLVILGFRRSISSILRRYLLPKSTPRKTWAFWPRFLLGMTKRPQLDISLKAIASTLPNIPTTAAYLVFCDGASALALEKDHRSAVVRSSSSFIVATNSDLDTNSNSHSTATGHHPGLGVVSDERVGMSDLIEDSKERRACMQAFWDKKVRAHEAQNLRNHDLPTVRRYSLRQTRSSNRGASSAVETGTNSTLSNNIEIEPTATPSEVIKWTSNYPITNEMTHFATVMDPSTGKVNWIKRYLVPVDDGWDF